MASGYKRAFQVVAVGSGEKNGIRDGPKTIAQTSAADHKAPWLDCPIGGE